MASKKLVEYVKKHKKKGYSDKQLHDHLVKQGFKSHEIKHALKHSKGKKEAKKQKQSGHILIDLFIGVGVLFILTITSITLDSATECEDTACFEKSVYECRESIADHSFELREETFDIALRTIKQGGECQIVATVSNHKNEEIVGKSMQCKKEFATLQIDRVNDWCFGELREIIVAYQHATSS